MQRVGAVVGAASPVHRSSGALSVTSSSTPR
jgi:hypothetical protein